MRLFISFFLILLCSFALFATHAEAKRFGGGRSFGVQRSIGSFSRPKSNLASPLSKPTASRWMGPLLGLLAGGVLASLLMQHGFGSGMLAWLAIGGLVLLVFSLLRGRTQLATKPNYAPAQANFEPQQTFSNAYVPDFDNDAFLRDAKVQFIRLQTAYDQKNLTDIRTFTSPEVYAEIQMQIQEMGDAENKTEVNSLNADLLEVNKQGQGEAASVRFTGLLKEDPNAAATYINEIWHFERANKEAKWLVAGIQQA